MRQKISWHDWLVTMLKEFWTEHQFKSRYEIVDIAECKKTGNMKAVIKLSARHFKEKNISEIVKNDDYIEGLDSKSVRILTYLATMESLKQEYSIVIQHMNNEVDEYILELKSRFGRETIKKPSSEISKDKDLLAKLNPEEAHRVGYLTGVSDTVKEYKSISLIKGQ